MKTSQILTLQFLFAGLSFCARSNEKEENIIIIPENYMQNEPPVPKNSTLNLHVEIYIWSITEISAKRMEMSVDTFVEFQWEDNRIQPTEATKSYTDRIPLSNQAQELWTPIVHYRNCRGCGPLLFDPKKQNLYYDPTNNTLWTSMRSLTTFSCTIFLQAFPMDKQKCRIQLESYFDELKDIKFDHGFDYRHKRISSNESLSEFEFDAITVGNCIVPTYDGKLYACIELRVHFYRRLGYYMTTIYAPTICIVVLSWISFWVPVNIESARITLGVTSLLTLATRLDQTQKNLPAVSYTKAIDCWMFACIFIVFASLIEFAISSYRWRIKEQMTVHPTIVKIQQAEIIKPTATKTQVWGGKIGNKCGFFQQEKKTTNIDKVSRVTFPIAFLIFNIGYWCYFLDYYE